MDWEPLLLSVELALTATALLLVIGIPIAYWLSTTSFRGKHVIDAIITLPLILPPTVLGFYLLLAFSPATGLGSFFAHTLGIRLAFSFTGLVVASVIYSLPFMVQPIQSGLSSLPPSLAEASYVLGKSKVGTLFRVLLPSIRSSLLTGVVLSLAHTLGEFGVVLMIGGSIPGKTRVASIAIYEEVEALHYGTANLYAIVLMAIAFVILLTVYMLNGSSMKSTWR